MAKTDAKAEKTRSDFHTVDNRSNASSSVEPALYYGFLPIKTIAVTPEDEKLARRISEGEVIVDGETHSEGLWLTLPEKVALLRTYEEKNLEKLPQPVMVVHERLPLAGKANGKPASTRGESTRGGESYYGLDIVGAPKSVAEAIIIHAAYAMLVEAGYAGLRLEVNSIGDKDSVARFTREFSAFFKKNAASLPATCRQSIKKDLFSILSCTHEKCKELALECPKSVNFLSERSRDHFKEVIEHLEASHIPYMINNALVANRDYCTETIFEIREESSGKALAVGFRYDGLGKRLGHRRDLPAVCASVAIPRAAKKSKLLAKTVDRITRSPISYIQLGFEAKTKSLEAIELLRRAKIAVMHSLAKDKIGGQVATAERNEAEVVIIMGKKEAIEDTVIVRDNKTRSQDTVPLSELVSYLKKMKM